MRIGTFLFHLWWIQGGHVTLRGFLGHKSKRYDHVTDHDDYAIKTSHGGGNETVATQTCVSGAEWDIKAVESVV